jgi:hypothetical protein
VRDAVEPRAPLVVCASEHALPAKPLEIVSLFGFPITNSMIVIWIAALCLMCSHERPHER